MDENPYICRMLNLDEDVLVLNQLQLDICFGYLPKNNNITTCVPEMLDFYGQIGYERTINLLSRTLDIINNKKGGVNNGLAAF